MVLNFDNVKKIVDSAKKITIMDCSCRKDLKHCDAPLETCMTFDEAAERNLTSDDPRTHSFRPHPITHEEAMEVLRKSSEVGLIHMAYVGKDNPEKIDTICSCCSCCCEPLGGILRFGMAPHLLKASAKSVDDHSKCINCGVCVDRCHFGARKIVDGELKYDQSRCFGCGVCVSTCPTNAISLNQLH
ncbi:4Fe-4S dicluster domain-containing protein [Candidatus Bathyarchaeota archaeon]|nr:4Fe-4S dicluster domain-containing protein [Candidatus Bathyarchaeota archaeon]